MKPVCDGISAKIEVVVLGRWSVDNHSAPEAITVLYRVMRMIPLRGLGHVLRCYLSNKLTVVPYWVARKRYTLVSPGAIGHSVTPLTLSEVRNCTHFFGISLYIPIHVVSSQLSHSVPMNAGSVGCQMAGDTNLQDVAPIGN